MRQRLDWAAETGSSVRHEFYLETECVTNAPGELHIQHLWNFQNGSKKEKPPPCLEFYITTAHATWTATTPCHPGSFSEACKSALRALREGQEGSQLSLHPQSISLAGGHMPWRRHISGSIRLYSQWPDLGENHLPLVYPWRSLKTPAKYFHADFFSLSVSPIERVCLQCWNRSILCFALSLYFEVLVQDLMK